MEKVSKKINLNKNIVTQLNNVKGGNVDTGTARSCYTCGTYNGITCRDYTCLGCQ